MVTIKEVAQLAGLSRTTVSRVLNNHPYVSEEKRELVNKAVEQLGYVPNSSAQRLRKNRTETIAVIISRIVNPFFSGLVDQMELIAAEKGYQLILCNTRQDKQKELSYLELLKTRQVDGVILASLENQWKDVEPYTSYGPIISCNEYTSEAKIPMILLDQVEGGYLGTKHLTNLGHTKIAYCGGGEHIELSADRKKGFFKAMEESGLEVREEWMFVHAYGVNDGQEIVEKLLKMKERPTAVFTGGDEVALGVISAAKRHGLHIPDDLAVIGFDNQPVSEMIDPPLTTIEQSVELIGRCAMKKIIDYIENPEEVKQTIERLPIRLVVRQSTAEPKGITNG